MSAMVSSYIRTRLLMGASAAGLAGHRGKLWRRLAPVLAATPALKAYAGASLDEVPIVTPADIRADYGRWNSLGLSQDQLHAAAHNNETGGSGAVLPGVTCGYSTGTSGQRGIFIASAKERGDYIGQSLARLLPMRALLSRQRIALALRANNALYTDVGKSSRIKFAHFPLTLDDDALIAQLAAFQPTILIAPTHKLVTLARAAIAQHVDPSALQQCFYGSEPMGAQECAAISAALGVRPKPIYQATEGFLAGACRFNALHLNDHSLIIEKHPIAGTNCWQPIVTDLRRTSQPIVRVLLDDVLEDSDHGDCPCGYKGRIIAPIMGRVADIWRFDHAVFTPDQISQAMEACVSPLDDWQLIGSRAGVMMALPAPWHHEQKGQVAAAFKRLLALPVDVIISADPPAPPNPKRQRIRWQGGQADV
jgi:putative adenylate-forming enzyme